MRAFALRIPGQITAVTNDRHEGAEDQVIGIIILTHNEELHLRRCLTSVQSLGAVCFVVDSFSSDSTIEIAADMGAVVVQRKWINYSDQFQFAIENFPQVRSVEWLIRLDADEVLEPELLREISIKLPTLPSTVSGVEVCRKMVFLDRWIKHGGMHPAWMLRIWRVGCGEIEKRWMDEHIVVKQGSVERFQGMIADHNLKGIAFWVAKHNGYSDREVLDIENDRTSLGSDSVSGQAGLKRRGKKWYARSPLFLRALAYWAVRYFLLFGFLDGSQGFVYHLFQALWYRTLVDAKLVERSRRL